MKNFSLFRLFLVLLSCSCIKASAFKIQIAATVDSEVITNYDVDSRMLLMKKLGEVPPGVQEEDLRANARERLINDTLLAKYGETGGFYIPEPELDGAIADFLSSLKGFKIQNAKSFLGSDAYKSAQLQIKGEIILSSLMHNNPGRNFTITENELKSFIEESANERPLSEAEARQLLTNIRLGELRANTMKGLTERAFIERQ